MDRTSKTVLWRRTCGRRLSYPTNRTPTQPTVSRPALTLHHREEREEERAQNAIFEQEVRDRRSWNLSPSSSSPTVKPAAIRRNRPPRNQTPPTLRFDDVGSLIPYNQSRHTPWLSAFIYLSRYLSRFVTPGASGKASHSCGVHERRRKTFATPRTTTRPSPQRRQ